MIGSPVEHDPASVVESRTANGAPVRSCDSLPSHGDVARVATDNGSHFERNPDGTLASGIPAEQRWKSDTAT